MSTAHLALNYRPQRVTGDLLRVARLGLKSLNYLRSVFTGWAVKFGLGAHLLSETHPLAPAEYLRSTQPHSLGTENHARTLRRQPFHTRAGRSVKGMHFSSGI